MMIDVTMIMNFQPEGVFMQANRKTLKFAICGGGSGKQPPSRGYGAENRFATALQCLCGRSEGESSGANLTFLQTDNFTA